MNDVTSEIKHVESEKPSECNVTDVRRVPKNITHYYCIRYNTDKCDAIYRHGIHVACIVMLIVGLHQIIAAIGGEPGTARFVSGCILSAVNGAMYVILVHCAFKLIGDAAKAFAVMWHATHVSVEEQKNQTLIVYQDEESTNDNA